MKKLNVSVVEGKKMCMEMMCCEGMCCGMYCCYG